MELDFAVADVVIGVSESDLRALANFEPVVLEAARRRREEKFVLDVLLVELLRLSSDSDSGSGDIFEVVATPLLFRGLTAGPRGASKNLEDVLRPFEGGQSLPPSMRGAWRFPPWHCGKWATSSGKAPSGVAKDEDMYEWYARVLEPTVSNETRVFFPGESAGPDAIAVLVSADGERVLPIHVQYKLEEKGRNEEKVAEAALRVDPSLLHATNRHREGEVLPSYLTAHKKLMKLLSGVSVLRVVVSAAAKLEGPVVRVVECKRCSVVNKSGAEKRGREGFASETSVRDVLLLVDERNARELLGAPLVEFVRAFKSR